MLAMEDLKGLTQEQIIEHIKRQFSDDAFSDNPDLLDFDFTGVTIIVAYESVGSWGCDSSNFFLFEKNGKYYENHGSHCSCHGFEGQWKPEETTREYLLSDKFHFYCGGYCSGSSCFDDDGSCKTTARKYLSEYFEGKK